MVSKKVLLLLAAMIFSSQPAHAGRYVLTCLSELPDCSTRLKDIVTDKFTNKFPHTDWEIVVIAEFQPYSDGGGVGYAVAGVSPSLRSGTKEYTLAPIKRYSATKRINGRNLGPYEVLDETHSLLRRAVEQLMVACETSSTCDVYTPY